MIIDKSSWHYKMNTYLSEELEYVDEPEEYNNLCPYFWYTVYNVLVLVVLFIKKVLYKTIPNTPPIMITDSEAHSVIWRWKPISSILLMLVTILSSGASFGIVAFLFLLNLPTEIYMLFKYGWDIFPELFNNSGPFAITLILSGVVIAILFIIMFYNWYEDRQYTAHLREDSVIKKVVMNKLESSITYNMIKSKKEKYCPRIEFKDLSQNDE